MRHFQDQPIKPGRRYRERPGAYAVILDGRDILVTEQKSQGEFQLPGGGVDPGEGLLQALLRESLEETGWKIRMVRHLGAFQRHAFMPEYDMWARKVCHVYLARPVWRVGQPSEKDHRAVWMTAGDALQQLSIPGDRIFLAKALERG